MKIILSLALLIIVSGCTHLETTGNSKTVYFAFGSNSLDNASRATIDEVVADINSGVTYSAPWKHANCHTKLSASCTSGSKNVRLVGHTDTVGNPDSNQALSQRRIDAVSQRLIQKGVDAAAITSSANGEGDNSVASGDNVKEAKNRRVVIYTY